MILWPDILIIAIFLSVTLWMGVRQGSGHNNAAHYLLGGRALTLPAFVATTVSTWYGGILGVGEYAWKYGISSWIVFGIPYYMGALLFALILSRRARASESLTIPHRFESHYGVGASKCAAILIFLTTVPGAYMLMMGTLCAFSFGISVAVGIAFSAVFVVIYLWRGGFTAVVRTDAVQFALMFGGFILMTLWLILGYGFEPLSALPPSHLEPAGGQPVAAILVWYVIALSTLAEPNFFQRAFAAKTPEIARNGLIISIGCWLIFDVMTTTCGLYARALIPNLDNPVQAFPALAAEVLPIGCVGIFFAGLFATILSSLDSNLFTAATTFGRDLWSTRTNACFSDSGKTKIGLVVGAILAVTIALCAGSVVEIWKIFGSVSAAALLIPIIGTYYPKMKMSPKGAIILMIVGSLTTIGWFLADRFFDEWPSFEPLFAGGIAAIFCFFADRLVHLLSHKT